MNPSVRFHAGLHVLQADLIASEDPLHLAATSVGRRRRVEKCDFLTSSQEGTARSVGEDDPEIDFCKSGRLRVRKSQQGGKAAARTPGSQNAEVRVLLHYAI